MKTLRPGLRVADDGEIIVDISALLKGYDCPDTPNNRMRLFQHIQKLTLGGKGIKIVKEGDSDFVPVEEET